MRNQFPQQADLQKKRPLDLIQPAFDESKVLQNIRVAHAFFTFGFASAVTVMALVGVKVGGDPASVKD